jgi:hypothetical protein
MQRRGLILTTALSLCLTGLVVPHSAWLRARAPRVLSARSQVLSGQAGAREPVISQAEWRWRTCQPNHWRACLLQR